MPNSSISCWKVQEITQMMSLLPWSTSLGLTDVPSRDQELVSKDSQTSVIHTRTNTRLADYRRATGEAELTLNKCTFHFMLNSPAYDIFQLSRRLDLIQGQGGNLFIFLSRRMRESLFMLDLGRINLWQRRRLP